MFNKHISLMTFDNLPIRKKFALFSFGVLFWFLVMFFISVIAGKDINRKTENIVTNLIPHERIAQKIARKLQELNTDMTEISVAGDVRTLNQHVSLSMARIGDIKAFITAVGHGGQINDVNRNSNKLIESFTIRSDSATQETKDYTNNLQPLISALEVKLAEVAEMKTAGLNRSLPDNTSLNGKIAEYRQALSDASELSHEFSSAVVTLYSSASQNIKDTTRITLYTLTAALFTATGLLILFTVSLSKSIMRPVKSIINQIRALGEGEAVLPRKGVDNPKDEIGTLSEDFYMLMEEVHELATFKKVIEEDDNLQDVYSRLGKAFSERIGLDEFIIYEVSSNHDKMKPVHPLIIDERDIPCNEEILHNCDLCKVKKTGHTISSIAYPEVCKQFRSGFEKMHVCIPMITGGKIGGVIQFLFDRKQFAIDGRDKRIYKAEQYVKESLSVIEAKRLMNTLQESALRDSLTGLYNRRFLQDYTETLIAGVLRREKNVGLIMCDLDFFKQVNDLYGHNVGDTVLKETAEIIKKCIRSSDLIIRFGGEEFLVLMLDINLGETAKIAEKIRETIEKAKIKVSDGVIKKTVSLGISEFPLDTESFWQAIKFADIALYRAKEKGRNKVVRFSSDMWAEKTYQ